METVSDPLIMWTVYRPGRFHPNIYLARESAVTAEGSRLTGQQVMGSLDRVRDYLSEQLALTPLDRSAGDDPSIVEVWV